MYRTLVFLFLVVGVLPARADQEEPKRVLVSSTTQTADFARQVVGDRWEVKCILAPGQDPHLYEIKPGDAKLVAQADLCVQNGWHLEGKEWMKTLATNAGKPLVTCVDGLEPLELHEEGVVVYDPHAWFSTINAAKYVQNIVHGVSQIDPENKDEYIARGELYVNQLRALHSWIKLQVNAVPTHQRVLVTSHDAFGYFCSQYGFTARAPAGWSTGAEAGGGVTPERLERAFQAVRESGVKAVFVETSVNPKLIREMAANAGIRVGGELYSDSMGGPGTAGESYIGMMRENVLLIVNALK